MYDRVIGAFVSMLMLQKKEQIAVFTKSQEVDTAFYVSFSLNIKIPWAF